jgi:hypothetical protein
MARALQCVASAGRSVVVLVTTYRTVTSGSGFLPGGRVLSRSKPSTPASANRACQRYTVGFDCPVRSMISMVPTPSAVSTTIRARRTCFCGVSGPLSLCPTEPDPQAKAGR